MNRNKILITIIIFTAIIIFLLIVLSPNTRYKKISISESKWNSIKNSRNENQNLVLEDIKFNDYSLIIDKNSRTLYYSLVNDSKSEYNPNVSYSTKNRNVKLAILSDEITDEKVKSNYKFKIMVYNNEEYNIYDLIYTDLPIVNIKYNENIENKQKNIPMEIYVFNNLANTPNRITISKGKLKINEGGNYTFSLDMITPGNNIRDNKISILNMKPNSHYILTTEESKDANKNHKVELFINNEYKGIYYLGYIQKENK